MQHLNYCRQLVKQFRESIHAVDFPKRNAEVLSHFIDLANASTKFILPDGGRILDTDEFRGLDDTEALRLPFPFIAIEYSRAKFIDRETEETRQPSKALVFARERDDEIVLSLAVWFDERRAWTAFPEAAIPKTGYLDRAQTVNGVPALRIHLTGPFPGSDYMDEAGAVLSLLEALNCHNVRIAQSRAKKAKKPKGALPFDDYHVLVLGATSGEAPCPGLLTTHRSPREHLRRGHIRRLSTGRRTWVNATIVAAGRKIGRITKDYAVQANA